MAAATTCGAAGCNETEGLELRRFSTSGVSIKVNLCAKHRPARREERRMRFEDWFATDEEVDELVRQAREKGQEG